MQLMTCLSQYFSCSAAAAVTSQRRSASALHAILPSLLLALLAQRGAPYTVAFL